MAPKKAGTKSSKAKALAAAKAVAKGTQKKSTHKVLTKTRFFRPKTLRLARKPRYARTSVPKRDKMDKFAIIKHPWTTESAMNKVEENNTLTFITDPRSNKRQIRAAVESLYNIKVAKVNTLIRPDGKKKAYIRLDRAHKAIEVANKIGIL
eukprot:TRINITY_DN27382_c0_g1_i1.p1 TRINITY_DN27382_c0_g1~~TRINITY_DN27382_c0_g1_i1.p1  ORF type:complete len:151 (+),score=26.33 TRINITY_DN27382_c0_g1_i1:17-469(+)